MFAFRPATGFGLWRLRGESVANEIGSTRRKWQEEPDPEGRRMGDSDGSEAFAEQWPALSVYLHRVLGARHAPAGLREDLVQETGLRLFQMWDTLDRSRPLNGLAATICLNLLRDETRSSRFTREVPGEIPEAPSTDDVEVIEMARAELSRVGRAMSALSKDHRLVLMREVTGEATAGARGSNATKMLRLRARRRLTHLLEAASVWILSLVYQVRRNDLPASAAALAAATLALAAGAGLPSGTAFGSGAAADSRGSAIGQVGAGSVARGGKLIPSEVTPASPTRSASSGRSRTRLSLGKEGGMAPAKVGVGDNTVEAGVVGRVDDVTIGVGESGGPVPACVSGLPGIPRPLQCPKEMTGKSKKKTTATLKMDIGT